MRGTDPKELSELNYDTKNHTGPRPTPEGYVHKADPNRKAEV